MVQSLYKKPTPGLKNHMRNMGNYRKAGESPKSWNMMGYFCLKNTFLQLKHLQRIYPTLLSTSCMKIYQMNYFIFETICHFSRQPLSISKWKFSDLPLLALKFTKFLMSFLEPRVSFSSNFAHSSVLWDITLLYFFI